MRTRLLGLLLAATVASPALAQVEAEAALSADSGASVEAPMLAQRTEGPRRGGGEGRRGGGGEVRRVGGDGERAWSRGDRQDRGPRNTGEAIFRAQERANAARQDRPARDPAFRQERREDRQEFRRERREDRAGFRQDRDAWRSARPDSPAERPEWRRDGREIQRDFRQDRREDRRDFRRDRQEDRRDWNRDNRPGWQGGRDGWNGNRDRDRDWNRDRDGNRDRDWNRNDRRWDRNDRRWDRDGRDWNRNDRGWNQGRNGRGWDRDWRRDRRYDWQRWRQSNRDFYRMPRYYAPRGWGFGYRRFDIGISLFSGLYGSNYWINDPWQYRLPPAYGDLRWVRYYDDALLVDLRTGRVVDVIYEFFW